MDALTQELQSVKLELSILITRVKCLPVHKLQESPLHHIPKEPPLAQPPDAKSTEVDDSLDGSFLPIDEEITESLN